MSATGWATFAHRFSEYYRTTELWSPPRISSREWMLTPFGGKKPLRHRAFRGTEQLRDHLVRRTPASVFYSTSYWKYPEQQKLVDKDWMGADLIFDLDGDHLPGISTEQFPLMLESIQHQAWKLWSEFLCQDFGFKEEYLQVTFSGHRGFHLHYRDPSMSQLDSNARRELVSHIRGASADASILLATDPVARGWGPRVLTGCANVIGRLDLVRSGDDPTLRRSIIKEMTEGMNRRHRLPSGRQKYGEGTIEKLAGLFDSSKEGQHRREQVKRGRFDCLGGIRKHSTKRYRNAFEDLVRSDQNVVLREAGETDDQVTIDVRRQIRYPSGLHGKTGFRVTEFPLSRLDPDGSDAFDALSEAVVFSTQRKMAIEILVEEAHVRLNDVDLELMRGQHLEVSEAMATFLVLKGWAVLP